MAWGAWGSRPRAYPVAFRVHPRSLFPKRPGSPPGRTTARAGSRGRARHLLRGASPPAVPPWPLTPARSRGSRPALGHGAAPSPCVPSPSKATAQNIRPIGHAPQTSWAGLGPPGLSCPHPSLQLQADRATATLRPSLAYLHSIVRSRARPSGRARAREPPRETAPGGQKRATHF